MKQTTRRDLGFACLFFAAASSLFWGRILILKQALYYDTYFKNFFPDAVVFKACLLSKVWPFWNPYMYSGVPFLANTEGSIFYPTTLLQAVMSYPDYALLTTWLHAFLAGVFMFVLARKMGLSFLGALLGGMVYSLNGYYVDHYAYPHTYQGYAWVPFMVWSFQKSLEPKKVHYLILSATGLALQILSGHPQFVFYSCLILLIYSIWWSAQSQSSAQKPAKIILIFIGIVVLAILMAAIQVVPTLLFAAESPRRGGSGYAWSSIYSLNPAELIRMFLFPLYNRYWAPVSGDPNVVGIYVGWTVSILSVVAIVRRKTLSKGHIYVLCTVAGLGLFLSMGKFLPIYPLMYKFLFPIRIFRFPAQALCMPCFGFALLASYGLDSLAQPRRTKVGILFLCLLDLWIFSFKAIKVIDPIFYELKPKALSLLREKDPYSRFFLTPKTRQISWRIGRTDLEAAVQYIDTLYPNLATAYGLYDADGLQELRFAKYEQVLNEISKNPLSPWMNVLGIRYIFSFWANLPPEFKLRQSHPFFIYENPRVFPKAYAVSKALSVPLEETISYVADHPQHDFSQAVMIDQPFPQIETNKNFLPLKSEVHVRTYELNKVVVEATTNAPSWLVLSDGFDKGWSAAVNGVKIPVFRANAIFRAVQIPQGVSEITFDYVPEFFNVGKYISLTVVICSAICLLCQYLLKQTS